ncbi:MAG TPA: cupin-like domain-containing protein [Terricaulis sp.]|nr:cupin-like domain-containing protein [Terricaulis sp.]
MSAMDAKPIPEWRDVTRARFLEEIAPRNAPAVLRGLVRDWPAVQAGRVSAEAACAYVKRFDIGRPQEILVGPPEIGGRFFYRDDMSGFNFERQRTTLPDALDRILASARDPRPAALYVESTPVAERIPEFSRENTLDLVPPSAGPRIWIGNATIVQTHFDLNDNIACVIAGRRRFTLFPPDQIGNLYVGPLDFTLSGPPVSMVDLNAPDLARFPRFSQAQAVAQAAELEPGDAIYIPYGWWHQVEALAPFNMLLNYWWNEYRPANGAPFDAMLHAVMVLRELPEPQRAVWRSLFDHYAFKRDGEPVGHLPPEQRGMMGAMNPERVRQIKAILLRAIGR